MSNHKEEFKKYEKLRLKMYDYFDGIMPRNGNGFYEFEKVDKRTKEMYEMFFQLDYQARVIRGIAINCINE
jgi:hypothetical protein